MKARQNRTYFRCLRKVLLLLAVCVCCSCGFRVSSAAPSESLRAPEPQRELKVRDFLRLGTAELRRGNPAALQRAEAYFELILELQPGDPRALDGLGSIAFRLGRLNDAVIFFKRAYRSNPGYDRPLEHLAACAAASGNDDEARELLRRALRLNPLNYRARNNLAELTGGSGTDSSIPDDADRRMGLLKARSVFEVPPAAPKDSPSLVDENLDSLE